jgi:hypothetical protein
MTATPTHPDYLEDIDVLAGWASGDHRNWTEAPAVARG